MIPARFRLLPFPFGLVLLLIAAGCSDPDRSFSLDRSTAPSAPQSSRLRPLSVPPIIGLRPGLTVEPEGEAAVVATAPLFDTAAAGPESGQAALLQAAGADRITTGIRAALSAEARPLVDSIDTVRRVLYAGDGTEAPDRAAIIGRR